MTHESSYFVLLLNYGTCISLNFFIFLQLFFFVGDPYNRTPKFAYGVVPTNLTTEQVSRLNYVRVNIGGSSSKDSRSHVVPVPKNAVPGQKIFFEINGSHIMKA